MHRFMKWRDALSVASNEKAVEAIVREYVGVIDRDVMQSLPPECQAAMSGEMDLQSAAVALLHAELSYRGDVLLGEVLHEAAQTFAAASIRISRLRTEPIVPAPK